jgi:hypothetical protein
MPQGAPADGAVAPASAAAVPPLPISPALWWGALQDQFTRIAAATVAFGAAGEAASAERRKADEGHAAGKPAVKADRRAVGAKVAGARLASSRAGASPRVAVAGRGVPGKGAGGPALTPAGERTGTVGGTAAARRARKGPGALRGAPGDDTPGATDRANRRNRRG